MTGVGLSEASIRALERMARLYGEAVQQDLDRLAEALQRDLNRLRGQPPSRGQSGAS